MGNGIIHQRGPQKDKDNECSEANPFDERTNDECRCDNGEHPLEGHISKVRNRRSIDAWPIADVIQTKPAKSTEKPPPDIFAKSQTISEEDPLNTDQGKDHHRLFDNTNHIFASYHTSVEKAYCWGHNHD